MEEIRRINTKKEETAYSKLAAYCFADTIGWTDRIFPLDFGDVAWGMFADTNLASAAIIKPFDMYIFNTLTKMSGYSAVETSPEYRNRGYIRQLFTRILNEDLKKGILLSTLMPFKYEYYEKFGFGYFGGSIHTRFEPHNIKTKPGYEGELIQFSGKKAQLTDMYDVHDIWVRNFTGGIKSRRQTLTKFKNIVKWSKDIIFLYYKNNECKAYIRYRLQPKEMHATEMEIKKAAWRDNDGFRGLLHFMTTHRDQCNSIVWQIPKTIPFQHVCKNPRIEQSFWHEFMIRPLDIEKIIKLKADYTPATEKITFSIDDPVLTMNKGTYTIEGKEVKKEAYNGENRIPLPIFSSLISGALSLKDVELIGIPELSFPVTAYSFFQKNQSIYVSELF